MGQQPHLYGNTYMPAFGSGPGVMPGVYMPQSPGSPPGQAPAAVPGGPMGVPAQSMYNAAAYNHNQAFAMYAAQLQAAAGLGAFASPHGGSSGPYAHGMHATRHAGASRHLASRNHSSGSNSSGRRFGDGGRTHVKPGAAAAPSASSDKGGAPASGAPAPHPGEQPHEGAAPAPGDDGQSENISWGEQVELSYQSSLSKRFSVSASSLDSGSSEVWKRERETSVSSTTQAEDSGATTASEVISNAVSMPDLAHDHRTAHKSRKKRLDSASSRSGESGVGGLSTPLNKSSSSLNDAMRARAPSVSSVASLTSKCILCYSDDHETMLCEKPTVSAQELRSVLEDVKCPLPAGASMEELVLIAKQFAWLKSVRLHKYAPQLVGTVLCRLPHLTADELASLGLTAGASKKLLTKAGDGVLPWPTDESTAV